MKTSHKTISGNGMKILKSLPDDSTDLVFANPPRNLPKKKSSGWELIKNFTRNEKQSTFSNDPVSKFNREWIRECFRILKYGGSLWVSGNLQNIYQIGFIIQEFYPEVKINNSIIWFKPNTHSDVICRTKFVESTEHLIWTSKNGNGRKWKFNYYWTKEIEDSINKKGKQTRSVWAIPAMKKSPNQKPFELLKRIILACTDEGDLVLDAFANSDVTSTVARHFNRNSISVKISK